MGTNKPSRRSLLSPELDRFIEAAHRRRLAEALARDARAAMAASPGGAAARRFVATRLSNATRRTYAYHLHQASDWLFENRGVTDLLETTPEDLSQLEGALPAAVSARTGMPLTLKTRQERVRTLMVFFRYCADEGLVERSPARHLRVRGRADAKRRFLEIEEVAALLRACSGSRSIDVRDRAIVTLLLCTGLRSSEAAGLTWSAIEWGSTASVRVEGKGLVVRTIPLPHVALAALGAWAETIDGDPTSDAPVWRTLRHEVHDDAARPRWRDGKTAFTPQAVQGVVRSRSRLAGLTGVTPHALRRAYASRLHAMNVDLVAIQRYLGHTNLTTTLGYLKPPGAAVDDAVRAMAFPVEGAGKKIR